MSTVTRAFAIRGMHCSSCAMSIDWELEDLDGVTSSRTSYPKARTEVTFDPARVDAQDILDIIARAGFTAEPA